MSQSEYERLAAQAEALVSGEKDLIANMANISALLFNHLEKVNWAGFYLYKEDQLVLGPFQGQPACIRIPMNQGVCGTAAADRSTLVVEDVHAFDGHIACAATTRSEIVLPVAISSLPLPFVSETALLAEASRTFPLKDALPTPLVIVTSPPVF